MAMPPLAPVTYNKSCEAALGTRSAISLGRGRFGEVLPQRLADARDCIQDARLRLAAREEGLALLHDVVPKRVTDALVQLLIADDGELPCVGCNQNQCAVARLVAMQLERAEFAFGPLERVDAAVGNHPYGNAPARAILRLRDRVRDPRPIGLGHGLKLTAGACCAPGC